MNIKSEFTFIRTLVAINLSSAMEYRAAFITQILGMLLNNGIYFVFWLLFFDKFGAVNGYEIGDIYLLFGIVAMAFGIGSTLAHNTGANLAGLIAQGRLDYYLALPRNVLTHVIFSRMAISAIGDLAFGMIAYLFTGRYNLIDFVFYLLTAFIAGTIYVGFSVITGSFAFFIGNSQNLSMQASNALITFALYPNTLFSGFARFLLYTLVPAAFVGAIPVQIVKERNLMLLLGMIGVAVLIWLIATFVFYTGLRRYESGSAMNVNL
jgi:ABC-2 type transport system permease protein